MGERENMSKYAGRSFNCSGSLNIHTKYLPHPEDITLTENLYTQVKVIFFSATQFMIIPSDKTIVLDNGASELVCD